MAAIETKMGEMIFFRRLVFVATFSTALAAGCAGKAVDQPNGDGDGSGAGDGDGPPQQADPLSDAGFPDALEESFGQYCRNLEACDAVPTELSCEDAINDVGRLYDVDSRTCRSLILESLDCLNDSWSNCGVVGGNCAEVGNELDGACAVF